MNARDQETLAVSLTVLAAAMRQDVSAESIALLADDLADYELDAVQAALLEHRKRSVYFPALAELLPYLDSRFARGGSTERIGRHADTTCLHVPKCRTVSECIDKLLGLEACRACRGVGFVVDLSEPFDPHGVAPKCEACAGAGKVKVGQHRQIGAAS